MKLSSSKVTAWKQGSIPKIEILQQIASYFNVTVGFLFDGKEKSSSSELSEEEHNYTECYVAFLDILGFKEFILDKSSTFEKIKDLFDLMKQLSIEQSIIIQSDTLHPEMMKKVKFNFISDTVILSIPKFGDNSLELLIFTVDILLSNVLLNHQLLFRGAISEGTFYSHNDTIFGSSIVNAAILKKESAIYPRIIIPSDIINSYKSIANDDSVKGIQYLVEKDFIINDDFYTINYIKYTIERLNFIAETQKKEIEYSIYKLIEKIKDNINNSVNENVRKKNIYFARYYNHELSAIKKLYPLKFKCEDIFVTDNYLLGLDEEPNRNSSGESLNEQEIRMLKAFRSLTPEDRLIEIGRAEGIAEKYSPENQARKRIVMNIIRR